MFGVVDGARAERSTPRTVSFQLSDGNTMAGYVYGESRHKPLVIMVHGASDSHTVFDFAPGYTAARDLAQKGFGVLTVDRVGYGASSHPNGDTLTFAAQAAQLHDVVTQVRDGALGFTPDEIVLLGPSVGADIVMTEAGTYHDVDGVVVSFNTAQLQPALFEVDVGAWLAQGPYFDFGVDFRTDFFYAEPWANSWVIALDNATRNLVPRAEILSALGNESAPFRSQIDVPVLLMQADHDHLFVPQDDSALFSSSPDVSFELLKHSGHKGFSHPTSKQAAVRTVERWLQDEF
ncbi:MAG: alpha/beta fold hydrolase [Kofleriaceae bacterium]|nr:alpha/beta fold hydrolase [Kofleriaceae bacterium]